MNTNIKGTNIELTAAITEYVHKRIIGIEKFLHNQNTQIHIEVGKTTNHHKKGELYKAEINMLVDGKKFHASSTDENLYSAIDAMREEIVRSLTYKKDKSQTLFKRGATSVKKMLKGLSKRNPFTSKY